MEHGAVVGFVGGFVAHCSLHSLNSLQNFIVTNPSGKEMKDTRQYPLLFPTRVLWNFFVKPHRSHNVLSLILTLRTARRSPYRQVPDKGTGSFHKEFARCAPLPTERTP